MEQTDWEHSFPSDIIIPPDKTSFLGIKVECLDHMIQFDTEQQAKQHIEHDHQNSRRKTVWKYYQCKV